MAQWDMHILYMYYTCIIHVLYIYYTSSGDTCIIHICISHIYYTCIIHISYIQWPVAVPLDLALLQVLIACFVRDFLGVDCVTMYRCRCLIIHQSMVKYFTVQYFAVLCRCYGTNTKRVLSHIRCKVYHCQYICTGHHVNQPCHTCERVMSLIQMSHVTHALYSTALCCTLQMFHILECSNCVTMCRCRCIIHQSIVAYFFTNMYV